MARFSRWLRQVLAGDTDGPTTLEARKAVLDAVDAEAARYQTLEAFPFAGVEVTVRAPEPERRAVFEAALDLEAPPFSDAVATRLREAGHALPARFRASSRVVDAWPDELGADAERWVHVRFVGRGQGAATGGQALTLTVVEGRARDRTYTAAPPEPVTLGRGREHRLADGSIRTNTVAFFDPANHKGLSDEAAERNRRVSRCHATLHPDERGYRIGWDGGGPVFLLRGGTRVRVDSVHQRVYLEDGDRLSLADGAVLAVSLGEAATG